MVRTRRGHAFGVVAALLLPGVTGCMAHTPDTVSLRMQGAQQDASVTVDDQYLGALGFVAKRGVALPPGQHRVTVEKPGYFPWDRLVTAESGAGPIVLTVELRQIPD
ncbi:PEGA domain-containing protein [Chondromyces crocatus]|nr:PEGA domain-containing protein [Chondromyces crocatus]